MKTKEKIIFGSSLVLTFFLGIIATMVTYLYLPNAKEVINKSVSEVSITEKDTIKSSIDKIYDATVLIETYDARKSLLGSGTGFVYKKDDKSGYILTNYHVIEDAKEIIITMSDKTEVTAEYKGSDEYTDLAVLTIPVKSVLKVAEIGNSSDSEIGDTVFTVGSPLGKDYMGTVTKGILSGKDRQVSVNLSTGAFLFEVLQTDAAINPGNSGGPLVNINGKVIGINSLKLVQDEIEGMGFALPIEYAFAYTERLEKGETIIRPVLGVQIFDLEDKYYLYQYDFDIPEGVNSGIVIASIEKNTTASNSKLKEGDIVIKLDKKIVKTVAEFRYALYKSSYGDKITLTVNRAGKVIDIEVNLIETKNS